MRPDTSGGSMLRQRLLDSLKETRTAFAKAGDFARAMKVELGIQMLLDKRVSDRMLDLLAHSAAVAARDAAGLTSVEGH